jgi:glycogen(starch) synthase
MSTLPNRILMTADTVGGVWNYALELTRALSHDGVEVCLATMGPRPTSEQRAEAEQLENLRLFESGYKLEWMQDPWDDIDAAGKWLRGLEDRLQPDIVHLNGYCHGDLDWQARTVMVAHSCVLSWWRAVRGEAVPTEWDEYRRRVWRGLHAADVVVAPTRSMLDALSRNYGEVGDAHVIYNGRDGKDFAAGWKEPFVFAAGRLWDRAKNIGALDGVADRLRMPVFIAGDATEPAASWQQSRSDASHRFLGKLSQDEMRTFMANASIFAAPAKYEPFGLCILEAALSGCALVLGDIPSLRELWDGAALFVDPENDNALAEAIELIETQEWMRSELAWRARERAARYSTARMAEQYLHLYRALMVRRLPAATREVLACVS